MLNREQKYLSFGFVFASLCLGLIFFLKQKNLEAVKINGQTYFLETVRDKEKMRQGLGGRNWLWPHTGMLFEFPVSGQHPFWMKEMRFDLDILWLEDGKIVQIESNVSRDFLGIIFPREAADQVLELPAGSVEKLGLEVGQKIDF